MLSEIILFQHRKINQAFSESATNLNKQKKGSENREQEGLTDKKEVDSMYLVTG